MKALIERLEAATGPSRDLNFAIEAAVHGVEASAEPFEVPTYTSSLDAALTLVPEGCGFAIDRLPKDRRNDALVNDWDGNEWHAYDAATPALALCIAALKARASEAR